MSCTVVAVPFAISHVIIPLVAGGFTALATHLTENSAEFNNYTEDRSLVGAYEDEIKFVSEQQFVEQQFETPFIDKEILMKTLEEHGLNSIKDLENEISGKIDNYTLTFKKQAEDKPYILIVKSLSEKSNVEKLNDISSEYAMNLQEESYLSIVKNLKANNMEIEEEEVMEDNTIVLTVNLGD